MKAFVCEIKNTCEWLLTFNEEEAKATRQSYSLASLDDMNDWLAATGEHIVDTIIQVKEGFCKWYEREINDLDLECGYELISEYINNEPAA
jgi:hypothetical protein